VLFTSTLAGRAISIWRSPSKRPIRPSASPLSAPGDDRPGPRPQRVPALDFICRREFDYSVVEFAQGKPLNEILGISYRQDGKIVHTPTVRKSRIWTPCPGPPRSTSAIWT